MANSSFLMDWWEAQERAILGLEPGPLYRELTDDEQLELKWIIIKLRIEAEARLANVC